MPSPNALKRQASSNLSQHSHPANQEEPHLSPPPPKRQRRSSPLQDEEAKDEETKEHRPKPHPIKTIPSPFHLTHIQDLPPSKNRDTITLPSLLGDPLVREAWLFNFLFDIPFILSAFDQDIRNSVNLNIIHGFWKPGDRNGIDLKQAASDYKNIRLHQAKTKMYGTHHSKLTILLRSDDTAQIVIGTANMIPHDWKNMTQALWMSPKLPLLTTPASNNTTGNPAASPQNPPQPHPYGSGQRFKDDLLAYLQAYDREKTTCAPLYWKLRRYNFSSIRGALVASVPGAFNFTQEGPKSHLWGHAALRAIVSSIPIPSPSTPHKHAQDQTQPSLSPSTVTVQISSLALLGPSPKWISTTLSHALGASFLQPPPVQLIDHPDLKIVFPTPEELRRCLDGYVAGGSIHCKSDGAWRQKQLQYLKPTLYHWANDCGPGGDGSLQTEASPLTTAAKEGNSGREDERHNQKDRVKTNKDTTIHRDSGRNRAAPHVKTYIRHNNQGGIDWALLTSANLSRQAWGTSPERGKVDICSWEIGVMIWPALYEDGDGGGNSVKMVPTFMTNTLSVASVGDTATHIKAVVGLRMPYSLPLKKYGDREVPWDCSKVHDEPDWTGATWQPPIYDE